MNPITCPHCGHAFEERERWMTREQLAEATSVNTRTVDRWRNAGMPSALFGPRSGTRRFEFNACMAWLKAAA